MTTIDFSVAFAQAYESDIKEGKFTKESAIEACEVFCNLPHNEEGYLFYVMVEKSMEERMNRFKNITTSVYLDDVSYLEELKDANILFEKYHKLQKLKESLFLTGQEKYDVLSLYSKYTQEYNALRQFMDFVAYNIIQLGHKNNYSNLPHTIESMILRLKA